jgi:ACS family glucarate transporter-like MFS transporter
MNATQLWIALLMFGFSLMSYFDRTILSVAAPGIIKEFSLSETEMGVVFSAFQFSYMLVMIPGGRWADRFGPRLVLAAMGAGAGIFTALLAAAGRPGLGALIGIVPAFVLMRLAFGVVTAPLYPTTARMNANWIPAGLRSRVQGIVNSGAGFGGAVSPMLFSWMIRSAGWRQSFVLAGGVTIAGALVWYFTVRDRPHGAAPSTGASAPPPRWRPLLKDANLQWLTAGYFAVDYFEYIFFYWLYYYLGEVRKLSPSDTAFYTTLPFVAFLVMVPLGGWAADRIASAMGARKGLRLVGAAGLGLSAVFLCVGVNMADINLAVGLISLALGFCAISDVVFWTATIGIAGEQTGAACGILNTGGNLGGFFAPLLTPVIARQFGWSAGLYFGGFVALLGLFSWFRIDPERRIRL